MHISFISALLAGTAISGAPAIAQDAAFPQNAAQAAKPSPELGPDVGGAVSDIVVTARREKENLQDVPVSVQVVTGDQLKKLSINDATELTKLAPGLTLGSANDTSGQKVVLRGVAWQPGSGTPATPIYFNEAPFDPANSLQSIFDVGQIEVLRGPQGTSRGAPSISGAVTITTRRPDLQSFGGYVQGQYGEGRHSAFQGAVNVPVIKDVLAIRAATDIQDSKLNRVDSVNSTLNPKYRSRVYRLSALFQPIDTITIGAMWQRRLQLTRYYDQVAGPGSPGAPASGIPANFNGPALTDDDRKSVEDVPNIIHKKVDLITINASWNIFGNTLSYNFGRQIDSSPFARYALDKANFLPGFEPIQRTGSNKPSFFQTNEIRLSSQPNDKRPFDYDFGWFSKHSSGPLDNTTPVYLTGAFGAPGTPPGAVTTPSERYTLPVLAVIKLGQVFDSFYGNVRAHLDRNTELSAGFSIIRDRIPVAVDVFTGAASTVAAPLSALGGLPCSGIPGVFSTGLVNSTYSGFCDFNIPAGSSNFSQSNDDKYSATIYNVSVSHKFSEELLVYATTGTSFRSGLPAIANTGLPRDLLSPKPEKATSYEVGVKTSFSRRIRVNADIFQIDYDNQLTTFQGVPYYNSTQNQTNLTNTAFYRNVNARVRGAEVEIATKPLDHLSLDANLSYSKIKSRGGQVPCNLPNGPAITAANPINFCASPKGQVLNTQAPFQTTVNGSYDIPVTSFADGYVRFNVNYQGRNPNFGNFTNNGESLQTKAYALVDLFAGISAHDGSWDLGIYAKNAFNKTVELNRAVLLNNIYPPYAAAAVGYNNVGVNLPREIGVTLRYAFGSR